MAANTKAVTTIDTVYRQLNHDYQVAMVNARKNFEQGHMARWINKAVYSSITPQLEKQIMDGCLANLRELSKTNKAT